MSERRNALGRGLEQLFSDDNMTFQDLEETIVDEAKRNDEIVELNLSDLRPNPYQPRKKFDEEALNEFNLDDMKTYSDLYHSRNVTLLYKYLRRNRK